jgi:hypothetical protein
MADSLMLPRDGQIKMHPSRIDNAALANHAVGERRPFKITQGNCELCFTGRLAYDEDMNLTVIDIEAAGGGSISQPAR